MATDVDAWMAKYDNPQKSLVEAVRQLVLKSDKRIGETIKWQAPTFVYKGNLASFYPKSKAHVSLMFHTGAKIAEDFIDRLESKVAQILKSPETYRIVTRDLRCANLERFPYQIVYRNASKSQIRIVSVRHHKRHPDFGLDR